MSGGSHIGSSNGAGPRRSSGPAPSLDGAVQRGAEAAASERLLTLSEVARLVGVAPATLRTWERRYGFPRPRRTPGGRRAYDWQAVEQLRRVQALRREGVSLPAAISRAAGVAAGTAASELAGTAPASAIATAGRGSLFAALRRRLPRLQSHVQTKAALTALSHGVEDEAAANDELWAIVGCFQRARFLRSSLARWEALAEGAQVCLALHCGPGGVRSRKSALAEVVLEPRHPLAREWSLVAYGPALTFALVARERLEPAAAESERTFEALVTLDSEDVRTAIVCAAELLAAAGSGRQPRKGATPAASPASGLVELAERLRRVCARRDGSSPAPTVAASLLQRTLAHVGGSGR